MFPHNTTPKLSLMLLPQFGLYSFLEYENSYVSTLVSSAVALQTLRVLITSLAV